jgi:hypothetical protein
MASKSTVNAAGNYTKPTMRKALFQKIKAGTKGGDPANGRLARRNCWRWSTRKKAVATDESPAEKPEGLGIARTGQPKVGKPSSETGERYLPAKAIKALTAAEYAATTRAKREATKAGKQFAKQPKKIAEKIKGFQMKTPAYARKEGQNPKGGLNAKGTSRSEGRGHEPEASSQVWRQSAQGIVLGSHGWQCWP